MLSYGDVYFVKRTNTASCRIEVVTATATSGYATAGIARVKRFNVADGPNGTWGMV